MVFMSKDHSNMDRILSHFQAITQNGNKIQSSFSIQRGLAPGPPWIPNSIDAQVPYVKW